MSTKWLLNQRIEGFCALHASYAAEHAEEPTELRLGADERAYGEASQLLQMVGGWRSTTVEVDGSPEPVWVAQQMLWCAREWLRSTGACRERPAQRPDGVCVFGNCEDENPQLREL